MGEAGSSSSTMTPPSSTSGTDAPGDAATGTSGGSGEGSSGDTTTGSVDTTASTTTGSSTTDTGAGAESSSTGVLDVDHTLYVRENGQNSNPGTPEEPLRTVQWALDQAGQNSEIDTIRVAGGVYEVDVAGDMVIVMLDGVSLIGGWSDDFSARDPAAWPSRLVDSSAEAPSGVADDPACLVEVPAGVSSATSFEGFIVEIGRGSARAGMLVEGDASIVDNVIIRGSDEYGGLTTGIRVQDGAPHIERNRLQLDYGDLTSSIWGIDVYLADPVIANNDIYISANASRYALRLLGTSASVLGNTIEVPAPTGAWFIRLLTGATPRIENNIVQGPGFCIASLAASAVPTSVRNNLLQCPTVLWANGDSNLTTVTTIADLHASVANSSDNLRLAADLGELQLDATAPCTVSRGGLDLTGEGFVDDNAGAARTAPVSIGAYEWDGACE